MSITGERRQPKALLTDQKVRLLKVNRLNERNIESNRSCKQTKYTIVSAHIARRYILDTLWTFSTNFCQKIGYTPD